MRKEAITAEQQKARVRPPTRRGRSKPAAADSASAAPLLTLQNQVGNAAVQRLLAQRSADGAYELDDETAGRINRARGGGHALDETVQSHMGEAMGQDFSDVRVHTSGEADQLNRQLNAKAFTTGQDLFFRAGEYSPRSSGGQELLAHELSHVVQQHSGQVGSSGPMTVNDPGDQFERQADAVAQQVTSAASAPPLQRQELDEDELQAKTLQRQELEEEDPVQMQELAESEEELEV
jgi:hypothetical protein